MKYVPVEPYNYTFEELLKGLYNRELEIQAHIFEKGSATFLRVVDVDLQGIDGKPDCCINSFSQNWYIRTIKGLRKEKYKTLNGLIGAIENELKKAGYKIYLIAIVKFGTNDIVAGFTENKEE